MDEAVGPRRRRVLFVSYLFPPTGGSGVQRNLKFAKYLPSFGWGMFVLSVKDIHHFDRDESLVPKVPAGTTVIRTGSADPLRLAYLASRGRKPPSGGTARPREGSRLVRLYRSLRRNVLFPDGQAGWIPFAYARGVRAIREHGIDVIVASVQPVSSAIIARMLSRKTGVPYVIDFRDGWTDDPYLERPSKVHQKAHQVAERRAIMSAAAVTVFGEALRRQLADRYPQKAGAIHVLRNGFDPEDFMSLHPAQRDPNRVRLSYVGTLQGYFGANVRSLLSAITLLDRAEQEMLDVQFIGQVDASLTSVIKGSNAAGSVKFLGYMPHAQALSLLISSDAALLILQPGDKASLTGKVYEYIAAGRPIVASIEPDSSLADLLREAGHGAWIVAPTGTQRMAQVLRELIGSRGQARNYPGADLFDRRRGARRLTEILNQVLEGPPTRPSDSTVGDW